MSATKKKGEIKRTDIEAKLRQIQSEVDEAANTAKPAGLAIGAAVAIGALGLAFVVGQRKSEKQTTIVEVRRV